MSNILKIATLKYCGAWKLFGENFPSNPYSLCYDGENIWVAGSGSNNVIRMGIDGAIRETYTAGSEPRGICFDGVNVWVANSGATSIYRY